MSAELRPIVTITSNASQLKATRKSCNLVYNEPCQFNATLDNRDKDYNPTAAIANPRTYSNVIKVEVDTGGSWTSPDFLIDDYEYNTETCEIDGRCKLSLLDVPGQVMSDSENTTVAIVLGEIAAAYGLTVTGAPSRVVRLFHRVGNPLDWFRRLLEPTHIFRMGTGNEIVVESISSNPSSASFTDRDDLENLSFKRTNDIYNSATVERVVPTAGIISLVNEERSNQVSPAVNVLGGPHTVTFSEPSRNFRITKLFGRRGKITTVRLKDSMGTVIGTDPYPHRGYNGTTAIASMDFTYELIDPSATNWGDWTPRWEVAVDGYPLSVDPVPTEGYSQTYSVGGGSRPYPDPFTSLAIDTEADALAAATALVTHGTRIGNILNFSCRLQDDKIVFPNQGVTVTDDHSGFIGVFVAESVRISQDENGDTGTLEIEATRSEAS